MTLLLWFALGAVFNEKVSDLGFPTAHAGWEYNESARPKKKKSLYPKAPAPPVGEKNAAEGETAEAPAPSRVQVFGKPATEMSADDYARMLKEDQAATAEPSAPAEAPAQAAADVNAEPVAAAPTVSAGAITAPARATTDPSVDSDFEALRARLLSKRVAENTATNEQDYEPEAPTKKPKAVKARPARKTTPNYIPPPPPMETEVITPQKPTGKKVKGGKTAPAIEGDAARSDEVNSAFPFTHLLPSPFNLPHGTWMFGTSVGYGIFDFLQISTNVAHLIQQHWNVQAKVPLIEYPTFIASAFVDYESFNPYHDDATNPDAWVKRWKPGLVTGYEITPDIAFFLGGNFAFGKTALPVVTTSGYMSGAQVNMEWSWLYNPSTSRLGNNAISLGIKYDFTYSMLGFGFTHHWKAFEAGLHYTFADRQRFLPIFGFNIGTSF